MDDSENRSIDRVLSGDVNAFANLVERYQDRLFSALFHATGDRDMAEEVTQEAFVTAFTKLRMFRQESSFYTWLYRIAFNGLATQLQKRRVHASLERDLAPVGCELADRGVEAVDQVIGDERSKALHTALQSLSGEHRQILILREWEGLDYDRIAAILEIAVGTVRSRLHRARAELRARLAELEDDWL